VEKYFIHTVAKGGENLNDLAARYGCTLAELWELNQSIRWNPFLCDNWGIRIPTDPLPPPLPALPPPSFTKSDCLTLSPVPSCQQELVDVVHITGEPHFYVLTQKESKALKQEIAIVGNVMDDYRTMMEGAKAAIDCQKVQRPMAQCTCTGCLQQAWAIKAQEVGVLTCAEASATVKKRVMTQQDLAGQRRELNIAWLWYHEYEPPFFSHNRKQNNWAELRAQKKEHILEQLDAMDVPPLTPSSKATAPPSIQNSTEAHTNNPAAASKSGPKDSSTNANTSAPGIKYGTGSSSKTEAGVQTRSGITVVEVILFSDPSRRHYIPVRYLQANVWAQKVSTKVMAGKPFDRQLAGDLLKDIKSQLSASRKVGPLGALEFKLSQWTSQDDNLLNALHQELAWTHNEDGAIPYAVSAEAHALRFAASASAGINSWNPKEGNVDIGVKGTAAYSLAEACVSLESFFPDQGGYVASMDYRNAKGDIVQHPIGVFRLEGKLELSCFVGAQAQVDNSVRVQYRPAEVTSGASALLGTPTLDVGRGASIGVKAGAFVGAQVGGVLSGSLKWIEPQRSASGKMELKKFNEGVAAQTFATIKTEGNGALGAGISGEFGISIGKKRLMINCSGSMVLGPGVGGGFSTEVDLEQIGKLTMLLCNTLAEVDYRLLLGVTEDAFDYICQGLFRTALLVVDDTAEVFERNAMRMYEWWNERVATWEEAGKLTKYLLDHNVDKVMMVCGQAVPLSMLPPQTLGPMIHLLIEGSCWAGSHRYELALVVLLSEITTWRQFIEVLEHASVTAEKVEVMGSLERINALLNEEQQISFNKFIDGLTTGRTEQSKRLVAWRVYERGQKDAILAAASKNKLFSGLV
jgi:hypothetical protein